MNKEDKKTKLLNTICPLLKELLALEEDALSLEVSLEKNIQTVFFHIKDTDFNERHYRYSLKVENDR